MERPASSTQFQSEQDVFTVLSPSGWKSVSISEEESLDKYSIGWKVADEANAGIGPYEELEFSLVTSDKNYLGTQQFTTFCDHIKCNYDGWTLCEGTRPAAVIPKFMKQFDMEYVNSIPTYKNPSVWGVSTSTPRIFNVTFFPLDARPVPTGATRMLDGSIGTTYPKLKYEGSFSTDTFDPISRTIVNGVATLDFIATFNFNLGGSLDGNGDGTVSETEQVNMNLNSFLVEYRKKSTNAISLSLQLNGGNSFDFKNLATGKSYTGASSQSFLERPANSAKFWSEIRIETFRDGGISVVGRAADSDPEVLVTIPPSDGAVASFDYIKVSTKRPPGVSYWIEYKFDEFRISQKHNELTVSKLSDMGGNPVQTIQPGVSYKLIGAGFRTTMSTPELKFGSQACSIVSFNDKEIVFSCADKIQGYRNVTLKAGQSTMEGKFFFNKKLRALIPILFNLLP